MHVDIVVVVTAVDEAQPAVDRFEKLVGRRVRHGEEELAQQHGAAEADRTSKRVRGTTRARAGCRVEGEGTESRDPEASGCVL